MITTGRRVVMDARTGTFLRQTRDQYLNPSGWIWVADRHQALDLSGETAEAWLARAEHRESLQAAMIDREPVLEPMEHCPCCGLTWREVGPLKVWTARGVIGWRCWKHEGRNPCAIEGCTRTRAGEVPANDQSLCAEHWKRLVPPRSRERIAYHRHWRRAKRYGWTDDSIRAFHRFWDTLIARARRRATEGHLDIAEINRIMGWD